MAFTLFNQRDLLAKNVFSVELMWRPFVTQMGMGVSGSMSVTPLLLVFGIFRGGQLTATTLTEECVVQFVES
jgi:hypothetical protein